MTIEPGEIDRREFVDLPPKLRRGKSSSPKFLIWSNDRRAWHKPRGLGYTEKIEEAGIFSLKAALPLFCARTLLYEKIPKDTLWPVPGETKEAV